MESVTGDDNLGKQGQELADKTADKFARRHRTLAIAWSRIPGTIR
jgi:hypothetical protein